MSIPYRTQQNIKRLAVILLLLLVVAVICIALFAVRCAGISRSSFYTIGGCTAAAILATCSRLTRS